ncbi:type VI secretion system baseplate subunit TssF [Trinickia soli]|uniref:Type VI secretion system baseplate subunit TssF n=1 Tax=Trinickia soli TaxID=380675 RepID=A0A2N7W402_9BURK|nr:type VI secretion system baseplate subunit TssF [Trinickia soli]PMS24135.1 type VI secretion system baseplate subunit TssF [Trinickia soli]CAB3703442.1 hypothetical protein LMG24076_03554 [Trinickia soli]
MDDLESLRPYFERELTQLRQEMLRFERANPTAATRLSMSGGQTDDPHVEHMLQQAAWLNANAAQRIDDRYSDFTVPFIETVFPAYLQAVPSCSIACVNVQGLFDGLTQTVTMPQGTELEHRPSPCRFTTAWDLTLAPLAITRAQCSPPTAAPTLSAGQLPDDTAGILSIEFASPGRDLTPESELLPRTLRVYLCADRLLAAALVDAILLHPPTAFVETDESRRWQALERPPACAVGFDREQALIGPLQCDPQPAMRLLIEYAAFPHKFRFIDIDFAALQRAAGLCNRFTLHLPVAGHAANASAVQALRQLNADHLRLFCTPVVNLFKADAKPVDVKADVTTYPVAPPDSETAPAVIRSIDSVRMMHGEEGSKPGAQIPPHHSLQHWSSVGVFWVREQDRRVAREMPGCNAAISLLDIDERPVAPNATKLAIELTCTNGDLEGKLAIGAIGGDLHSEAHNLEGAISMLIAPSASRVPPRDDQSLWRLVSAFSPNIVALAASSLAELQSLLLQIGKLASPETTRYIAGITRLRCMRIRRMMDVDPVPMPILVPGLQITLTIDETAFAGHALHTFAQLMERYFLRYADQDCIELIVKSHRGADVYRGEPLLGSQGLTIG